MIGGIARRALLIALLGLLVPVSAASARENQSVTFEAPRDLLNAKTRAKSFAELDSLGVRSIRVVMYWKDVAPAPASRVRPNFDASSPAGYNWSKYEPALAEAQRRGWSVLLTVTGPVPLWASNGATSQTYDPRPAEFEPFLTAVSRELGKYVTRYSIYNEPNHPKFLTPQYDAHHNPVSPKLYRGLYAAALRGLADAGDVKPVLMGETSPRGTRDALPPLEFLRDSLCLDEHYVATNGGCPPARIDGWATHPYTGKSPYAKRIPKDDVTIGTLGRLTTALDRAAAAGAVPRGLPIYLTEFGMQSKPDPLFGLAPLRQAEYRSVAERIAWSNPRVASFAQYLLRDDLPRKGKPLERYGGFETGLRWADGKIKPAFAAFRLPLAVKKRGGSASLWGLVRPARGRQTVLVQVRDRGHAWAKLATVTTNDAGYWQLNSVNRGGRQWRVRWRQPGGRTFTGPPTRAYR